ncbi:pilus assembly FimT family protein [Limisphaera sp. 4302-co]|uniref:pilus assembly FimT family protein n=1 Tax=Limisphaera sp. 4302-co TaxID=3400417 RepID=UPI003C2B32B0
MRLMRCLCPFAVARGPGGVPGPCHRAFTLLELLTVLVIMGILAALTVPALKNFGQAEAQVAGTRQLLDDLARARQVAISQRTTVYVVFLPASFWLDASAPGNGAAWNALSADQREQAVKLFDKQLRAYNFVTVRSVGDQPGARHPRYLSDWRILPDGVFIPPWKFTYNGPPMRIADPAPPLPAERYHVVQPFRWTRPELGVPFPTARGSTSFRLPYLAFNHLGQLVSEEGPGGFQDASIPLARGSVTAAYGPDGLPLQQPPSVTERPPGNSTNAFNLVHVEWLTGRARVIRQEVR